MAIYRKETVAKYLAELDAYYEKLRNELKGSPPNENLAHNFHREPSDFLQEFTDVDLDRLDWQIGLFKETVKYLNALRKKKPEKPNGH